MDLAALRAKLAAQRASLNKESENEKVSTSTEVTTVNTSSRVDSSSDSSSSVVAVPSVEPATVSVPSILGTAKTSEIDHLDFLSKMNKLAAAIHTKHPTMPVLLMQIHKQLRADPELVTTLDEDAIGIVVKGLQIHTKTELVSTVVKESKSKAKKIAVSVDML